MATTITTPDAPVTVKQEAMTTSVWRASLHFLRPAIVLTLALTIITGMIYPGIVTGLAQTFFSNQANGSLVYKNGQPIASAIIGEYWTKPQYFHGRPSVTVDASNNALPYNAANSGGSNLGPTNASLITTVQGRIDALHKENPDVPGTTPIPADLVTASASGLDPDLSVASAYYQIPRIAKARGMAQVQVTAIIDANIQGRFLGLFGEPRVNVLDLNLALDKAQGQ